LTQGNCDLQHFAKLRQGSLNIGEQARVVEVTDYERVVAGFEPAGRTISTSFKDHFEIMPTTGEATCEVIQAW